MKVKELRVGNYVRLGKQVYKVKDIFDDRHVTLKKPVDDLRRYGCEDTENPQVFPVELDEKWMLAFGFAYDARQDVYNSGEGCRFHLDLSLFRIFLADATNTAIPIQVRYVHQLQNLYYALCGEELEFEYRNEFLIDDPMIDTELSGDSASNLYGKVEDHYQSGKI